MIGKSEIRQSLIGEFINLSVYADFWLRSVVGERGKWSGGGEERLSESQTERNDRRRATDGSPPLMRHSVDTARDERAVCGVERASSRGG